MRLRFADCLLDTNVRELKRGERSVPLSPKAFCLLEVLAERRPRAVSHHELRLLLWPETMMGGTTIARLVNEVRTAIGDRGRSVRIIRTVHRFGYAFDVAAIEASAPHAPVERTRYAIQWGSQIVPLLPGENLIGRAADAVINLPSSQVSRRHARIVVTHRRATLEDLGSRNGTYLRDERIASPVALRDGDRIVIGPAMLVVCVVSEEDSTSTQAT